jgi:hypothetical protein
MITATDARRELMRLNDERFDPRQSDSAPDRDYLSGLDVEIAECRVTYEEVVALTEIATLRAELTGPQIG